MNTLIGHSLGRYQILEKLGEGGMAVVYKAFDTHTETEVAVKVIRADLFGSTVLKRVLRRFEREGKAPAKLSHQNIVNVIDDGEHETTPFLVMPFIPSGTLKGKLGKPVPRADAKRFRHRQNSGRRRGIHIKHNHWGWYWHSGIYVSRTGAWT